MEKELKTAKTEKPARNAEKPIVLLTLTFVPFRILLIRNTIMGDTMAKEMKRGSKEGFDNGNSNAKMIFKLTDGSFCRFGVITAACHGCQTFPTR
jgi:hypothetical protein